MSRPEDIDDDILALLQRAFEYARTGATAGLCALIDAGAPANLANQRGDSLLMLAAYHGHEETVEALLRRGADPELTGDRGQTPLAGAAFHGDRAMVELLARHGADVNARDPQGRTPLMFAAMFDRAEAVDALLALGADVRARDSGGHTALGLATTMGAQRVLSRLSAGSDAAPAGGPGDGRAPTPYRSPSRPSSDAASAVSTAS